MLEITTAVGATVATKKPSEPYKTGERVETRLKQGLQVWDRSAVGSAGNF